MKIYSNVEDALALWDAIQEDSDIFIPMVPGKEGDKNKIFLETVTPMKKEEKRKSVLRIFINRDEADAYRIMNASSRVTVAKTTMIALLRFMERHFKNTVDMDLQCVLSTIDMDGKFHSLDSLWSNNQIDN